MNSREQEILNTLYAEYSKQLWKNTGVTIGSKERNMLKSYAKNKYKANVNGLLSLMYQARRTVEYKHQDTSEFAKTLVNETKETRTFQPRSKYWTYRVPRDKDTNQPTVGRFVLNVNPDKELIQKLDNFCHEFDVIYKSAKPSEWHERIDPIIMYSNVEITPEMEKKLAEITQPHIRNEKPELTNFLDGDKISDGLFKAKEPHGEDVTKALESYKNKLPSHLYAELEKYVNRKNTKNGTGLGVFYVFQEFADKMIEELAKKTKFISISEGNKEAVVVEKTKESPTQKTEKAVEAKLETTPKETKKEVKIKKEETSFKDRYRVFFTKEAEKENSIFVEDEKAENFEASLNKQNGEKLDIIATPKDEVILSARDDEDKPKVPNQEDFEKIVRLAQEDNATIQFGDIVTPEFKARLLLACKTAKPEPAKMQDEPELTAEFLASIEPKTRQALEEKSEKPKPLTKAVYLSRDKHVPIFNMAGEIETQSVEVRTKNGETEIIGKNGQKDKTFTYQNSKGTETVTIDDITYTINANKPNEIYETSKDEPKAKIVTDPNIKKKFVAYRTMTSVAKKDLLRKYEQKKVQEQMRA